MSGGRVAPCPIRSLQIPFPPSLLQLAGGPQPRHHMSSPPPKKEEQHQPSPTPRLPAHWTPPGHTSGSDPPGPTRPPGTSRLTEASNVSLPTTVAQGAGRRTRICSAPARAWPEVLGYRARKNDRRMTKTWKRGRGTTRSKQHC